MENVKIHFFKKIGEEDGFLTAIENKKDIPFCIERIYYIWNVPLNKERGFHSHLDLEQMLICLNGSVKIKVEKYYEKEEYILDSPDKGLYIGPMIWREMVEFSPGSVLLVLASKEYSEKDYIRNKDEYMKISKKYFNKEKD